MSNKVPSRIRSFSLVCYLETELEVMNALNSINDLQKFAYIHHDKDDSQPHFHVALVTANGHTLKAISKYFINKTNAVNCFIEPLVSPKGIYTYMTHEEEEDKYKYNVNDIISNDSTFFATAEYINDISVDIINAMLSGMPYRQLVTYFGKHFVYNCKNFEYIVNRIIAQEGKAVKGIESC